MLLSHSSNDSQGYCYPHEQKGPQRARYLHQASPQAYLLDLLTSSRDVLVPDQVWREVQWHRPGVLNQFIAIFLLTLSVCCYR